MSTMTKPAAVNRVLRWALFFAMLAVVFEIVAVLATTGLIDKVG